MNQSKRKIYRGFRCGPFKACHRRSRCSSRHSTRFLKFPFKSRVSTYVTEAYMSPGKGCSKVSFHELNLGMRALRSLHEWSRFHALHDVHSDDLAIVALLKPLGQHVVRLTLREQGTLGFGRPAVSDFGHRAVPHGLNIESLVGAMLHAVTNVVFPQIHRPILPFCLKKRTALATIFVREAY